MSKAYSSIMSAMRSQVWAIDPNKLEAIMAFLALKAQGKDAEASVVADLHGAAQIQAARAKKVQQAGTGATAIAVLPVYGLILHRGSSMGDISGPAATSTVRLLQQFRQAVDDPSVQAIIFDIDSPGGTVEGVEELATEIRNAKGKKQTIAVCNKLCASAAYYIASACNEIVASPSSMTGSIGVYCAHEDASKYLENLGVKVSLIKFGENKAEGNPYEPLSDAARAHMQESVDLFGNMFEKAVAKGRKVSQEKVHTTFGQGLMFGAAKAQKIGMVDTIGTFDDVLARYGVSLSSSNQTSMRSLQDVSEDAERRDPQASAASVNAGAGCKCSCDACVGGDCANCTNEDCDDPNCACEMAAKACKARADTETTRLRLQLAAAA
jgi:signal peptide peptidase SppA